MFGRYSLDEPGRVYAVPLGTLTATVPFPPLCFASPLWRKLHIFWRKFHPSGEDGALNLPRVCGRALTEPDTNGKRVTFSPQNQPLTMKEK